MKLKHIIISSLLVSVLFSCEDKLNIDKHGTMGSVETYYETDDEALKAVTAVYIAWFEHYKPWYMLKNILSDDVWCGGGDRGGSELNYLNEYIYGTEHSYLETVYSSLYAIIYNANLVIENVEADSDVKRRAIAESKFFRAWAHFELVTLWGTAPVIDHLLSVAEYHQPNSDPATAWALIEQDLKEAINANILPSKTDKYDQETGIRVTKETAQAYLGKAYVFQEKWADAATMLDQVINSGLYDLYEGEYENILKVTANNCCESLLEGQIRNDAANAWSRYTDLHIALAWFGNRLDDTNKKEEYDDLAIDGYGYFNPRKDLYDAFVEREGADGYRLNQTMLNYDQVKNDIGITVTTTLYGHEGYFFWKNRFLKSERIMEVSGWNVMQYINHRVMRYAEVLLLAAEAHIQNGNTTKATEYVNKIRTRAKLSPLSTIGMEDVKIEKRLELCMESVRYQDLIRWGDAPARMGEQGKDIYAFDGEKAFLDYSNSIYGFKSGKHEYLPIPSKEVMLNPNIRQNPGW